MKKLGKARFIIVGFLLGSSLLWAGPKKGMDKPLVEPHPDALNLQDSFAKVAEAVKPAVVNISAIHIQKVQEPEFYFGDPNEFFYRYFGEPYQAPAPREKQREYRMEGTGSGVLIDPEGYVLTNNHVVQGADQLTVTLSDGKSVKGTVVGTDERSDLAIVRIKGTEAFPALSLGDSSRMRVGDWVMAVGSPFGLEQTVTAGIISAIRQSLNIEGKSFRNLLQTDAAINRGNSGGPLVNLRGELVGINTAIYAPTGVFSGIGFAIPVNDAKRILKELIEKGFVERSWMGVEITEIDEVMAQQFGMDSKEGALVNQVVKGSPAEKGGLKRGDVIVEVDGKKVKNVNEVQDWIGQTPPNTTVPIKVIRNGAGIFVKVKTEKMPHQDSLAKKEKMEPAENSETTEWLGATFSDLTPQLRHQYQIDNAADLGVVVVAVPANSVAAEAGLEEGDVIHGVNRSEIANIADLKGVIKKLTPKKVWSWISYVKDSRST